MVAIETSATDLLASSYMKHEKLKDSVIYVRVSDEMKEKWIESTTARGTFQTESATNIIRWFISQEPVVQNYILNCDAQEDFILDGIRSRFRPTARESLVVSSRPPEPVEGERRAQDQKRKGRP